jgi:hypothetical protein
MSRSPTGGSATLTVAQALPVTPCSGAAAAAEPVIQHAETSHAIAFRAHPQLLGPGQILSAYTAPRGIPPLRAGWAVTMGDVRPGQDARRAAGARPAIGSGADR